MTSSSQTRKRANSSSAADLGDPDRGFFVTAGNDVMMQPCLDPGMQSAAALRWQRSSAPSSEKKINPTSCPACGGTEKKENIWLGRGELMTPSATAKDARLVGARAQPAHAVPRRSDEGSARRAARAHDERARLSLTRLVSASEKRDLAFSNSLSNSVRVWVRILAA
jgi:hypothetical protein